MARRWLAALFGLALSACGTRDASSADARPLAPCQEREPMPAPVALEARREPTIDSQLDAQAVAECSPEMVLVSGRYCTNPTHVCKRWIDPPGPYQFYRCAEYVEPAQCAGKSEHKRFCIDRDEYVRPPEILPIAHQSWSSATAICASFGKRLCLESEWQFACEGEEMRPYPYGFKRDRAACNIDRTNLGKMQAGLNDLRATVADYPNCVSPFGVHGMSGNVEEWATQDVLATATPVAGKALDRSTMKGAWWLPGKNTCRAATTGHGETYEGPQMGVRCCKDAMVQ